MDSEKCLLPPFKCDPRAFNHQGNIFVGDAYAPPPTTNTFAAPFPSSGRRLGGEDALPPAEPVPLGSRRLVWFLAWSTWYSALALFVVHATWMFYSEYTSLVNRNFLQEARSWKTKCTTPPFSHKLSELCDEKMHWLTQGFSMSVAHIVWKDHRSHLADFLNWFSLPDILGESERVYLKNLEGMVMGWLHVIVPVLFFVAMMFIVRFVREEVVSVCKALGSNRKGRKRRSSDAPGWDEVDSARTSPAFFRQRPRSTTMEGSV